MLRPFLLAPLLLVLFQACAPARDAGPVTVWGYTEPGPGSVNSWVLEDAGNLVVIDVQRSLSSGEVLADQLAAAGKPLRAVLITHPHPDHFGGLSSILARFPDTPVLASPETRRIMAGDENGFIALTKEALGDDAPDRQPLPTGTFADAQTLRWGAISLEVQDIGRGEADAMTMFYDREGGRLFTGDVVENEMTGFLLEGHTSEWLAQLEALARDFGATTVDVYPGHGAAGGPELIADTAAVLTWMRGAVAARLEGGLSADEVAQIAAAYEDRFPDRPPVAPIPNLVEANILAVAAELDGDAG